MTSGDLSPDLRRVLDTFHCPMSPALHWSLSQPLLGQNMKSIIILHQSNYCHPQATTFLTLSSLNVTNHRNIESQAAMQWMGSEMWNVLTVTKPILKYCPPCIEDINNGQYLNILIPAWPVTPTRRGNSHRIVPGPIITNYWQKLVCSPPPSLCISQHSIQ